MCNCGAVSQLSLPAERAERLSRFGAERLTLYVNVNLLSLIGTILINQNFELVPARPPVTIRRKRLTLYVNATLLSLVGTILINQN